MKLKVFYLDDENDLCENFFDTFGSEEISITTFLDPKKAIKEAEASPPDLFFIDFRLPGMTGDDVAMALDPKIHKFLVTGDTMVTTAYEFIKVFPKPYPEDEIRAILMEYGERKKQD